jgi:uncharacterized protein Usg
VCRYSLRTSPTIPTSRLSCRSAKSLERNLDGPLHSVRYSHQRLIGPNEWRRIEGEFRLH